MVQAGQTSVCYDGDFYPFGGERIVTNTCTQNYKFEGKERDTETGNDDFGARYYTSRLGRWLSADWSAVPAPVPYANLSNPQTLNLYAMVSDNPETFADLDGHCWPVSACAQIVMTNVNQAQQWVQNKAMATGSPTLAATATFISGVTRDVVNGVASIGTMGSATGACLGGNGCSGGQWAKAVGGDSLKAAAIAAPALGATADLGGSAAAEAETSGAEAADSVSVENPGQRITPSQQQAVNEIGERTGCHTCGTRNPGTKSGNWVGDHQPSTALREPGQAQVLKPQCLRCSRIQGGQVAQQLRRLKKPQPQ